MKVNKFENVPHPGLKVWRHDKKDVNKVIKAISLEMSRLQSSTLNLSQGEINSEISIYARGAWDGYRGMIDLITDEMTPEVL